MKILNFNNSLLVYTLTSTQSHNQQHLEDTSTMLEIITAQSLAFLIVANGCQPNLGNCGFVGNHLQVGNVTTLQPSTHQTPNTPKAVTWQHTNIQLGKTSCELVAQAQCKPCVPGRGRCIDCSNALWTEENVKLLLSRVTVTLERNGKRNHLTTGT